MRRRNVFSLGMLYLGTGNYIPVKTRRIYQGKRNIIDVDYVSLMSNTESVIYTYYILSSPYIYKNL